MTTSEIKLDLIKAIIDTNDMNLLLNIETLLNSKNFSELDNRSSFVNEPAVIYEKTNPEEVYVFNEWQQKRINLALNQYENGECISDEEAQKEIQAWLED